MTITTEQFAALDAIAAKMAKQQGCLALQDMDAVLPILPALIAAAKERDAEFERGRRAGIEHAAMVIDTYRVSYGGLWPALSNVACKVRALIEEERPNA